MSSGRGRPPADLVIENAVVHLLDDRATTAESIAITDGIITGLGATGEFAARATVDAEGRSVVAGLVDGHAHLDREGLRSVFPSLAGAGSIAEILERVATLVSSAAPGEWIVTMPIGEPPYYRGLPAALAEGRWPTRHDLDLVSPDNPVYIRAIWGYWRHELPLVSVANTAALRASGITATTRPPWSGIEIERDATGEPTGVIIEHTPVPTAELTMLPGMPRFTRDHRVAALADSMAAYAATGTTMAFEAHGVATEVLDAYRAVRAADGMTVRARLLSSPSWGSTDPLESLAGSWGDSVLGEGDDWLRYGGFFLDPHLTEEDAVRATAMPYTGWAGFSSDAGVDPAIVEQLLEESARRGIRVMVMGTDLLDTIERVASRVSIAGLGWGIGHVSTIDDRQLDQIVRLGLSVTTHSNRYLYKQSEQLADDLEDEAVLVPLRSLLDAGVPLSFGTDNVPTSMWGPVWHAVARRGMRSGRVVGPSQALSRLEALRIATAGGARLTGDAARTGRLEMGRWADLAVLDANPFVVEEDALPSIRSVLTITGGRVAHDELGLG